MIKEIVEIKGTQSRFSIFDGNDARKIFTIFNAASDGSLAFHSYSSGKMIGELNSDSVEDGQTFKLSDAEMREFSLHKINFHRTGTVTRKDNMGERSHDDFCSINYKEIKDAVTLFVFQPTHLDRYPVINDNKEYLDLIQNNLEYLPPNIQFILAKSNYDIINDFNHCRDSIFFVNDMILRKFDLNLCINVRRHSTGKYPSHEVIASVMY